MTAALANGNDDQPVLLGHVRFLPGSCQVVDSDGSSVTLGFQARQVLGLLASWPNQVVSKDDLLEKAWGDVFVTENNLAQCVHQIRAAIGDTDGVILCTVPKQGYRLVPTAGTMDNASSGNAGRFRAWVILAAGMILACAVGLYAFNATRYSSAQIPASSGASLVILPFEDITGGARWERLGRGIAIGLSGQFARHDGLRVGTSASLEDTPRIPLSPADAAGRYDMRMVLDGTILAQDGVVRLTARLTDAALGDVVWSDSWDGPADNIFDWQDRIYESIIAIIGSRWTGVLSQEAVTRSQRQPTDSLDAYDLYLLGSAEKHRFTPESLRKAEVLFRRALAIDPDFARAWAGLDNVYVYLADYAASPEEKEAYYAASRDAKRRAYAADSKDPYVLIRYASLLEYEGEIDRAAEMLRAAVRVAPGDADILAAAAYGAAWRGITGGDPVVWIDKAISVMPDPPGWYTAARGMALFHDLRFEDAVEAFKAAPEMTDALAFKAAAQALTGDTAEAKQTALRLQQIAPSMTVDDLLPSDDAAQGPSWQAFRRGVQLAGLP